jgi:hypothetical protein
MLADIGQNQIGGDARHPIKAGLTELSFDVKFVGEAESAVELQAGIGSHGGMRAFDTLQLLTAPGFDALCRLSIF